MGMLRAALALALLGCVPPSTSSSSGSSTTATSSTTTTATSRAPPEYNECFTVGTMEADTPTNTTVLRQTLAQDDLLRRSSMTATGTLVGGFEQQIKRCDLPLGAAWFVEIGGPDRAHLQCRNMSINPAPADCQWSKFWGIQANASGPFADTVRGIRCERWEWWDSAMQYAFWGTDSVPLRTAKLFDSDPTHVPWFIDFIDFIPGPPASAAFEPVPDNNCPPASPPPPEPAPEPDRRRPTLTARSAAEPTSSGLLKLIAAVTEARQQAQAAAQR
jgi:hypothetical protein